MRVRRLLCTCFVTLLPACSMTPYRPPVISKGSIEFPGIGGLMEIKRPIDIVLVHGMCTHNEAWANGAMNSIVSALDSNLKPLAPPTQAQVQAAPPPTVQIIDRDEEVVGGKVHFSAILWSGLTTPLKQQLEFDKTGTPSDCKRVDAQACKPVRAKINGSYKDGLLDDCLADVLVYQGQSGPAIRRAIVQALSRIATQRANADRPLVLVSESLGSKIVFDALSDMLTASEGTNEKAAAVQLSKRLALVYMEANQLPLLGLGDQDIAAPPPGLVRPGADAHIQGAGLLDSLQRFLRLRPQGAGVENLFGQLILVAFTDPNDLLSYRLLASRYASEQNIAVADVLVSNAPAYFSLIEDPSLAHTSYPENPDVARLIACGNPKSSRCK